MGWYKVKRKILEKPYLLDPYRQISLNEAKALWRKAGYPSDEKLLNRACLTADKTPEQWSFLFDRKKERKRIALVRVRNAVLFNRPFIAVFAIVFVLVALLTFTIPGRAFVKNMYNTITKIMDNILYIRPAGTVFPDDSLILPQDIPGHENKGDRRKEYKSLKEAQEYIGERIVVFDNPEYTATDILVKESPISGTVLEFSYVGSFGINICMTQQWTNNPDDRVFSVDMRNADHQKKELRMGFSIEGFLTEDNMYVGFAIFGDATLMISIDSTALDWDSINNVLESLDYYNNTK